MSVLSVLPNLSFRMPDSSKPLYFVYYTNSKGGPIINPINDVEVDPLRPAGQDAQATSLFNDQITKSYQAFSAGNTRKFFCQGKAVANPIFEARKATDAILAYTRVGLYPHVVGVLQFSWADEYDIRTHFEKPGIAHEVAYVSYACTAEKSDERPERVGDRMVEVFIRVARALVTQAWTATVAEFPTITIPDRTKYFRTAYVQLMSLPEADFFWEACGFLSTVHARDAQEAQRAGIDARQPMSSQMRRKRLLFWDFVLPP